MLDYILAVRGLTVVEPHCFNVLRVAVRQAQVSISVLSEACCSVHWRCRFVRVDAEMDHVKRVAPFTYLLFEV